MKPDHIHEFEEIYEKESDAIFRFCLIRVSDREQALDITQDTFLRLWQTLAENTKIDNERAFLFTIARRRIIDWYRKKKSIPLDNILYEDEEAPYDPPDETTLENMSLGPEGRYLLCKLDELAPTHRNPVYLRFVEGLSPGEIGDILGISANAASVRINRGLEELRKRTGYDNNESTK